MPWHSIGKMSGLLGTSGSARKLIHILFAKCPLFWISESAKKLVHILFATCPVFWTSGSAKKLVHILFAKSPVLGTSGSAKKINSRSMCKMFGFWDFCTWNVNLLYNDPVVNRM